MRLSPSSILRMGIVLLMIILIPSCKTAPSFPLRTENIKQIPLRARFYISPEFRETAYTPIRFDLDIIPVLVGETIENGVKNVVQCAFRESGEISSVEGNLSNQGFDILVIPEITLLEMKLPSPLGMGRTSAILQIRWKIEDINRQLLWSETITATFNDRCITRWCYPRLMEKTIKDHFQQVLDKMTGYNWWN
jgi:hypothetical protein